MWKWMETLPTSSLSQMPPTGGKDRGVSWPPSPLKVSILSMSPAKHNRAWSNAIYTTEPDDTCVTVFLIQISMSVYTTTVVVRRPV